MPPMLIQFAAPYVILPNTMLTASSPTAVIIRPYLSFTDDVLSGSSMNLRMTQNKIIPKTAAIS